MEDNLITRLLALITVLMLFALPARAEETYTGVALAHETGLTAAAFSPDASRVATAGGDGIVRVWDVAAAKVILELKGHEGAVLGVAYSPDGGKIASSAEDKTARVFDAATGRELAVMKGHAQPIMDVSFSPDGGRIVTAGGDLTMRVWDVATGKELLQIWGPENVIYEASFSADGTAIVAGTYERVLRIFNAADGIQKRATTLPDWGGAAAFSPDGKKIVTGNYDDTAYVWDVEGGKELLALKGHESTVVDAQFSPDGTRIVTASEDRTARLWDAATGAEIAVLKDDAFKVASAMFSADGKKIVTASGPYARVWSKAEAVAMPKEAVGVWMSDFSMPDQPMPPELSNFLCISQPLAVRADGLVVMFAGEEGQVPQAQNHLRCDSGLSCQFFQGPPAPGQTAVASARIGIEGGKLKSCLGEECSLYARCPDIPWTDEQKAAGLPEKWREAVLGE